MIDIDNATAEQPRVHTEAEADRRLQIIAQHFEQGQQVQAETSAQRWRHLIRLGWTR